MTGKVRYTVRNYLVHSTAEKAGEAAECAGEQGKYWQMSELLFGRQDAWSGQADMVGVFKKYAAELALDQAKFDACLDGAQYAEKIQTDMAQGQAEGVYWTPFFFINGVALTQSQPYTMLPQLIDYYAAGGKPPTLEVAADSFNSKGKADAKVVITEFSDFQ